MNTGFGFSEMLVIVTLIIVFFGSKELPNLLRELAKFTAKIRRYSDRIKRELDDVTRSVEPQPVAFAEQQAKKKELRTWYLSARENIVEAERETKSAQVIDYLLNSEKIKHATMVMVYVSFGAEVATHNLIRQLFAAGKRVAVPYCKEGATEIGVAEIKSFEDDLVTGTLSILEPKPELRKNFFKSDLQAVVCPGVAFDRQGGRLGRGKGYYDIFLQEIRGKIPIIGIAFDCQMMNENLPFEYHDVPMDMVITESGTVFGSVVSPNEPVALPAG